MPRKKRKPRSLFDIADEALGGAIIFAGSMVLISAIAVVGFIIYCASVLGPVP